MQKYTIVVVRMACVESCTVQFIRGPQTAGGDNSFYDPASEESYRKQVEVDGELCDVDVLDPAGQENYTALKDTYHRSGSGFVIAFSATNRKSFDIIPRYYSDIVRVKDDDNVPMVLVSVKSDSTQTKQQVTSTEAASLAHDLNIPYCEVSLPSGAGVEEAFSALIRQIRRMTPAGDDVSLIDGKCGHFYDSLVDCFLPTRGRRSRAESVKKSPAK